MKKYLVFLFFSLIIFFSLNAQNKNDLELANIKGNVEHTDVFNYEIIIDDKIDTVLVTKLIGYYDEKGNMIKSESFYGSSIHIRKYKRDENQKVVEMIEYELFNGGTSDCNVITNEYINGIKYSSEYKCCDNNIYCFPFIHSMVYYGEKEFEYRIIDFDKSGNIERDHYAKYEFNEVENKLSWGDDTGYRNVNFYDTLGRYVKGESYFHGELIRERMVKFDGLGRLAEETIYDNEDKEKKGRWTWKYVYNQNGDHVDLIGKNDLGEEEIHFAKYEYDQMMNWVKRSQFKNGKLLYIDERKITYY